MPKRSLLEKWVKHTIRFRWAYTVLLVLLTLLSLASVSRGLTVNNTLDIWFVESDNTYQEYLEYQQEYGSDEIIIAALPLDTLAMAQGIGAIERLGSTLKEIEGVASTFSLATATYPLPVRQDVRWVPFFDAKRSSKQQELLFDQLDDYRQLLLSEDSTKAFLYIQLDEATQIQNTRTDLVTQIENTIRTQFQGAAITGPPILGEAYNRSLQKEAAVFGLLTLAVIAFLLFLLLPDRRYALFASVAVILPTLFLFGIIAAVGVELNMVSALIPTLLLVYALSDVVHVLNALHQQISASPGQAVADYLVQAIRKSIVPCALTTVTTMLGYFALYYSDLPALKSMGLWASIGILMAFILGYLVIVIGAALMYKRNGDIGIQKKQRRIVLDPIVDKIAVFTRRRSKQLILGSTLILAVVIVLALKVRIDTDALSLLADSKEKSDLEEIEASLGSSSRLQLNVSLDEDSSLSADELLNRIADFHEKLASYPSIGTVVSPHSFRSFLEQRYASKSLRLPKPSRADMNAFKRAMAQEKGFLNLMANDQNTLVFTLGFSQMTTRELANLMARIESDFERLFEESDGVALKIYGFATVFARLNDFVVESQLKTFAIAFLAIYLVLALYFRSLRKGALVMLPNLIPVFSVFALMFILDSSLGVTTAMITPIVLGIAMDDTLHLIYHFNHLSNKGTATHTEQLESALRYATPALLISTLALVSGFFIIALSGTPAVREFGLICLFSFVIALAVDLTFLPALVRRYWD